MAKSVQLEQEAEQARAQLADLLSELRGRLSPKDLVDQLMNPSADGKVGAVAQKVRDNPLSISMIGAGLAWIAMKSLVAPSGEMKPGEVEEQLGSASRSLKDTAEAASERGQRLIGFVQEDPVVMAGLGIALGAILGAVLPMSEKESRSVQSTAGAIKEEARESATELRDRLETQAPPPISGNGSFPPPDRPHTSAPRM